MPVQEPKRAPLEISEIVYAAEVTDHKARKTVRSMIAKKTPRVATIEKAHIERAYVKGVKEEQQRIEYFKLTEFFTRMFVGLLEKHIVAIGIEPEDNRELRTGRTYDYGWAPFSTIKDDRTEGGIGVDTDIDLEEEDELNSLTKVDHPDQSLISDVSEESE